MNYCIVDNWRSNTANNMWHIYIVFAVLFRGAYCNPLINTTEHSPCIVVIKHFGEQVKTLEVQWNSTIHLICDVSCVGPRPQLGLTWLYRDKNRSKDINIEKPFRSPKFQTYPTTFYRTNELVIRDFGPNEETDFICKGTITKQRLEAKVALIGTDCLLRYNFRCKLGNKCIDRSYLCNQHNECPDGEDEVGCAERPTVRIEPDKITVTMGTTGTLRCIVTGVPAPTITWRKARQELSANHQIDGDILRITQATMEDRGIYVCRAENIAGSDQDWGIVEVERRIRPKIDLYPDSTQTVSLGGNAFFHCRVIDGDPPLKVTWSRVGGLQLTERTEVMDNGVVMFKGTTQEEQGFYICTASNDMGTTTVFAKLIVQGPPTIVIQPSKTINAIVGQRVRMECIAQGEPIPSVYWINPLVPRLGDIVPQAGFPQKEGTAIFEITNVGKENTGFYTCVAQNAGGRTEDRVQLFVEEGQRAEVKIAGPGTLSVVDGGSVELACSASAILNPQIRWRRREGPLPPGHSLRGGILSIPQLTVEYGGEYICSTSSPEGSYQASVFIIVTVSPRLTVSPSRLVARAGENIILRCSPTGSGPFNIEWSKVNGVLFPRASENEGVLEIQQVTAADAGRYRCVATSASGSSEGYAVVEITVPPTVRAVEREYSVQQNAVVELRCDFTGSPEPSVRWDHESGELPLQHRVQDGVLIIYNVQPKDSGRYICTATNAAGTARDYVFVIVSIINGGETRIDTQIVNVGDRVEMECIVAGTPLPTIRWSRDDGPLPASAIRGDGILIIPDARLKDAGTYTCTAINQAGSVQSKVVLYVRARPLISVPQSSMTAALGDSASIRCEASGYPSPQITWYRKNGQMPSEYTIVDGNLKIPRVKTEDAGTYICSAQNQHGQSDASVDLKIGVSPRLTVSPSRLVARAGENIILRCSPTGSGPFNIEWSKVNGVLSPRASENEGVLEIQQVTAADAGRYRCVATSASGSSEGYAVVEITVPPTVRAVEREYSVQQNAVVELRCDFTGSPEPSVRWDHESGELPLQHRVQDGVLIIYNAQPKDSGRYICTATNAAGTARDYVFVTVSSGPVINGGETRIDTQIVNVGDMVEMECIVAASCRIDQFTCTDGSCVELNMRCDGIAQCEDRSDEIGCPCPANDFQCASLQCIYLPMRCDGFSDCVDRSDEIGCPTVICLSDEFRCVNQRKCLSIAFRCNGILDCVDGSDETECEKKKITVGTVINDDGDNDLLSTTDGVTDNNGEFTDTTTPFDYELYA